MVAKRSQEIGEGKEVRREGEKGWHKRGKKREGKSKEPGKESSKRRRASSELTAMKFSSEEASEAESDPKCGPREIFV